jgi:hypothetical protein
VPHSGHEGRHTFASIGIAAGLNAEINRKVPLHLTFALDCEAPPWDGVGRRHGAKLTATDPYDP